MSLTCAAQSPLVGKVCCAVAGAGMVGAAVGGATSSAQFSVATAVVSTSFAQPGSGAGTVGSTAVLVNSLLGAISFAACSSFSA